MPHKVSEIVLITSRKVHEWVDVPLEKMIGGPRERP